MPSKGLSLGAKRKLEARAQALQQKECWRYLLECKHSLDDVKGCPLCKLAQTTTREYYKLEQIKKLGKIAAGNLEKAQMRSELLEMWSRSQLSSYGVLKTGTPAAEISLCARALNALSWYIDRKEEDDSISWYFRDVRNDLELRKRLFEIGHYAALCIQSFVRSFLCRQRVKAFMMKRFEYTFPTRLRPGFYTDKKTKDFWPDAPLLIRSAGPTSPRTLVRRQNAVQKRMQEKAAKMKEMLAEDIECPGKVWRDKTEAISNIRQLAILRDVIACAFKTLTKRQSRSATSDLPVWVSLSHPAPSARQFGLNLVLEREPPLSETVSTPPAGGEGAPEAAGLAANDRLQILEELAWHMLKCDTPEDVIDRLTCEEVQPALSSGHQIAEDPHQVWVGNVNYTDLASLLPNQKVNAASEEAACREPITASLSLPAQGDGWPPESGGSFEDLDDEALLAAELGYAARGQREGAAAGLSFSSAYSSMESAVSPLASPRLGEDQTRWVSPVFPTFVYVPHLKHEVAAEPEPEPADGEPADGEPRATRGAGADDPAAAESAALEAELRQAAEMAQKYHESELVVPVQIQLRAHNKKKHPSGIFRLFFYDGLLVSVTQGSSWTCYQEINASKESIVSAILTYIESEQCQNVVATLMRNADDQGGPPSGGASVGSLHSQGSLASGAATDLASILGGFETASARGNLLPPLGESASVTDSQSNVGRSECVELYVPSDEALFGTEPVVMAPESINAVTLTVEECREQQNKNRFLKHLSSWRAALKAAMKRGGTKKKAAAAAEDGLPEAGEVDVSKTADNTALADIGRKFGIAVPYASDLVSTDYFRLLNMDVPISARPHMANREAFLAEYFCTNGFTSEISKGSSYIPDLVWQRDSYPLLKYELEPTDLQTLVPPLLLKKNNKHLQAPKFRAEPNASWYLTEMLRIACSVDLNMGKRLRSVRAADPAAFAAAVGRAAEALGVQPLAASPPNLNIVVLDVFVDIPKANLKDKSRLLDFEDDEDLDETAIPETDQSSADPSAFSVRSLFGGSKGSKNKKKGVSTADSAPVFDVSLHQIVGVFPSTLPRPPPSVDMGLASWDVVLNKGETPDTAEAAAKLSKKGSYGRGAGLKKKEANNWTTSRSLPGVTMMNKRLPTGNNCHFRILKTPLPQDYIEENVPKKFRKWLGMEY